jgi:hypothetical protein
VHANRGLFTTRSYELDRPKVVPNFVKADNGLAIVSTPLGNNPQNIWSTFKPGPVSPVPYPTPNAQPLGNVTDFQAANLWVNVMAMLGSVNINRPLADYRVDPTQPFSFPNNVTPQSAATADQDRQQLARDIFVRLATAVGAGLVANPSYTTPVPNNPTGPYTIPVTITPGTPQYYTLQYLAQLSVNIVDYIDNDDISTVFIWNPNAASGSADFTSPTDVDNRVVFGVERTRLVINEAYSEVTNDPSTQNISVTNPVPANANANVRFWLELLNPSTTATLAQPPISPINDGSVALAAYRIEIARANRTTLPMGAPPTQQGNLGSYLSAPGNVTGRFGIVQGGAVGPPAAVTPDIVYPLSASNIQVPPNVAQNGTAAFGGTGFQLVGPQLTKTASNIEFNPNAGAWTNALLAGPPNNAPGAAPGSNSMAYTIPIQNDGTFANTEFKRNVVLLRRLANPYLPVTASGDNTTNPYITVDMMDYVPSFDAVAFGSGDVAQRPQFAMGNTGYDPTASRFSVGKIQPFAGHAFATVNNGPGQYNTYAFPGSMVLNQNPAQPPANQPLNTFGQHNAKGGAQPAGSTFATPGGMAPVTPALSDTLMTPFDWMIHMDRPLVNQFELFLVRDTPPYRVTDQFITQSLTNTTGVSYGSGHANWTDTFAGLARGMEYLTVKSYVTGVPHGGRVPGRIGLNAVQDRRILQGLMDPQPANGFDINFVNNVAWQQWMNSRTPVETRALADGVTQINRSQAANATVHDSATGTDQPFLPFGAPAAAANPGGFAFGSGNQLDQWSILRRPAPAGPAAGPTAPLMYSSATTVPGAVAGTYPASQPNGPNYYRSEALRKMLNNTSTVNQQYLVILTIGYFQVTGTLPIGGFPQGMPQLGAEAYINLPGDMRQQVVAVVDLSNMALKPTFPDPTDPTNTNPQFGEYTNGRPVYPPFFTSLENTVRFNPMTQTGQLQIAFDRYDPGTTYLYVAADGAEVPIVSVAANPAAATQLVLGYGTEQQVVTVSSVDGVTTLPNGQQVGLVTVSGMTRTAWAGSCVSNARPGYPGPQPNFQYTDPAYAPVIPYIQRLR